VKIKNVFAENQTLERSIETIKSGFAGFEPKILIFFASSVFEGAAVSAAISGAFPGAMVFGCSTSGEITSGKMMNNSISAMGFSREAVGDVCVQVVEDISGNMDVERAFTAFEQHFGVSMHDMDPGRYVGIMLVDGLCGKEENLIDHIGDLTMVNFIGGSAGDDLRFRETHVYASGKSYTNSAVLALVRPLLPFLCLKTQSFSPMDKRLVVTSANEAGREVISFDGKPAAQAYAEALGVPLGDVSKHFMHNPLGLLVDGVPYVRSPQRVRNGSMIFYCGVKEGMELSILESTDIIADTRAALEEAQKQIGPLSGVINFNCILRTLELEQWGLTGKYGELFSDVPTAGLSTYGEQFIGHINQTATMLVFG